MLPHDVNQNEVSGENRDSHLRSAVLSWTQPLPWLCAPHSLVVGRDQIQNWSDERGPQRLMPASSLFHKAVAVKEERASLAISALYLLGEGNPTPSVSFAR